MLDRRIAHAAIPVVLATGLFAPDALAGNPAESLEGLEALRDAVEAEVHDPAALRKRSFELRYNGRLDDGEQLVLRLDPRAAFTIRRQSPRSFVLRITAPELLLQDDFLREIRVWAARESSVSLVREGEGRCALAVRFASDLGRPVALNKYRQVDIEWSPKEAARLVGRGRGHVLFRRNDGFNRTPVQVRAILTLGDGSERMTAPTRLGYCASESGSRLGVTVGGGGVVSGGFRGFGEIAVPVELRFERAHVRIAPALIAREDSLGIVGQALVGHRFPGGLGLRGGGEAGVTSGDDGGFRAAGLIEGTWALDQPATWELGLRVRVGTEASRTFGEVMATLSVLPFSL